MSNTLRKLIVEALAELVIKEDLEIPSQDGTAKGASPEDQERAKKATQDGQTIKFVKPGELEEKAEIEKKPEEESGGIPIKEEEVAPKVSEVMNTLQGLSEEISALDEFAGASKDKRMNKLCEKLAKHILEATKVVSEMKSARDTILQEDAEKSSVFADKVIESLGKFLEEDGAKARLKEKYMPFIAKARQKGKSAKEVGERIKKHRFEL